MKITIPKKDAQTEIIEEDGEIQEFLVWIETIGKWVDLRYITETEDAFVVETSSLPHWYLS